MCCVSSRKFCFHRDLFNGRTLKAALNPMIMLYFTTGKSFLVEIKTGKPWDNDFLFSSNENYQSTRREIEVKVKQI